MKMIRNWVKVTLAAAKENLSGSVQRWRGFHCTANKNRVKYLQTVQGSPRQPGNDQHPGLEVERGAVNPLEMFPASFSSTTGP